MNETATNGNPPALRNRYQQFVVPSYGRFNLVIRRGQGAYVWDDAGRRYLDLGGGIAVCCLGHAHPEIAETLHQQARELVHVSNLYYTEPQALLAESIVGRLGSGKCFFCNSGAEANEGLYKLARKFGHDEGRYEILTATQSFHGRTLAGIAATGQDKVKKGFEPAVPGFRHVPFNDVNAMRQAISPATVAILIEGVQGEGGITPATVEYLVGLRKLCDDQRLLFLMDGVQCGHYRTGRFQSFQRILEGTSAADSFLPDAISLAKSLGGGFPIGAFWVRQPYADLLGPGSHASTFGGTPLACSVASRILQIIDRDGLAIHARNIGSDIKVQLESLQRSYPQVIRAVRGLGLMIGLELDPSAPGLAQDQKSPALQATDLLMQAGMLVIPAGTNVIRLLPPLNLQPSEANEGVELLKQLARKLAGSS